MMRRLLELSDRVAEHVRKRGGPARRAVAQLGNLVLQGLIGASNLRRCGGSQNEIARNFVQCGNDIIDGRTGAVDRDMETLELRFDVSPGRAALLGAE